MNFRQLCKAGSKLALTLRWAKAVRFNGLFVSALNFNSGAYPTIAVGEAGYLTAVWQASPTSGQPKRLYILVNRPQITKHYYLPSAGQRIATRAGDQVRLRTSTAIIWAALPCSRMRPAMKWGGWSTPIGANLSTLTINN